MILFKIKICREGQPALPMAEQRGGRPNNGRILILPENGGNRKRIDSLSESKQRRPIVSGAD